MTTEQALDQMTLLAPHFAAILDDEDAAEVVKAIRDEKGDLPAGSTMQKLLPLFTGKHREHLFHIAAITEGKPMTVTPEMAAQIVGIIEAAHAQNPLPVKF